MVVITPSSLYLCVVEVARSAPVLAVKVPVDGAVAWRASVGRSDGSWSGVVELGCLRGGGDGSRAVIDEEGTGASKVVLVL